MVQENFMPFALVTLFHLHTHTHTRDWLFSVMLHPLNLDHLITRVAHIELKKKKLH